MKKRSTFRSSFSVAYLTFILLSWTAPFVHARESATTTLPLTASEQATRINAIACGNYIGEELYTRPQGYAPSSYIQRDYRDQYQLGSIRDRRVISERIGNQAGASYAAEHGWKRILGSTRRSIPQGPDSAYWDAENARLKAMERKGGSSRTTFNYSSTQGTNQYHIRAAWRAIRSDKTLIAEKIANARIIVAAQAGRLDSNVVRGGSFGNPTPPKLMGPWDQVSVRREAFEIEKRLLKYDPELRSVFRSARAAHRLDMTKYWGQKGLGVLGVFGSFMLAWDAYNQTIVAWESWSNPMLSNSVIPYLQTTNAATKWGVAASLGLGSAAQLGLLGQGSLKVMGQSAGKWFLPAALGLEALEFGIAISEYQSGRISYQQFRRQGIGTGIFFVCTSSGAVIGAFVGGVGTIPGATIGAVVGGVGEGIVRLRWYFLDKQFSEAQRQAKIDAIYKHYGVAR